MSESPLLKYTLRVASTAVVVIGAIALARIATPTVAASSSLSLPPISNVAPAAFLASSSALPVVADPEDDVEAGDSPVLPVTASLSAFSATVTLPDMEGVPGLATMRPEDDYIPSLRQPGDPWSPPSWFPASLSTNEALLALEDFDKAPLPYEHGPGVRSRSVFVYDLDAGQVLYTRNADNVRPVASLTKLVSSLALMSASPDLDRELCIGAEQYPTRSGARSHLSTGDCMTGWDVLGAALVSSDNRGAYALAAAAGMDIASFIDRMNAISSDLGMDHSSWSDPSGLEDENLSTARDMARAVVAVASHPVLSAVASAPHWDLQRHRQTETAEVKTISPRRLFSTDRLVNREDLNILAAKTGYTDTARYCFTTVVETDDGRRIVIALLGAEGKQTRWADVARILAWI